MILGRYPVLILILIMLLQVSCKSSGDSELDSSMGVSEEESSTTTVTTNDDSDDDESEDEEASVNYDDIVFTGAASATTQSANIVRLNFAAATAGSESFVYKLYLNGSATSSGTYGTGKILLDSDGSLYIDVIGLTASTTYTFLLKAFDTAQQIESSNTGTVSATTNAAGATFAGIASVDNETASSLRVNWSDYAGEQGYNVYNVSSGSYVYVATVGVDVTAYTVTGLTADTTYTFAVKWINSNGVEDSNTATDGGTTLGAMTFTGIDNITSVTASSMVLNWTHDADAVTYKVQRIDGAVATDIALIQAPTDYYTVSGLSSNTSYTWRVRATDTTGIYDSNTVTDTETTSSVNITHNGWKHVYAVGKETNWVTGGTDVATPEIELWWYDMTPSSGTVSTYTVYRSSDPTGPFTTEATGALTDNGDGTWKMVFTDEGSLAEGTAYFYKVVPTVGGTEYIPDGTSPVDHTVIRIVTPYENEGLVHRWITNAEMCDQYNRGIDDTGESKRVDFSNNYRCEYDGVSAILDGGTHYYDIEHDLMVDRFEMGCNVSKSACDSHTVGGTTTTDCVGNYNSTTVWASPEPSAAQYSVAYNKYTSNQQNSCFIQLNSGTDNNWYRIDQLTNNQLASSGDNLGSYMYTNKRGAAPINYATQENFHHICGTQEKSITIDGTSSNLTKRLLRRKEYMPSSLWTESLSSADINNIEGQGAFEPCDTSYGSHPARTGYDSDYNPTESVWPSSSGKFLSIGSNATTTSTKSCMSRFGMQDMVGNMEEIASDQFDCGNNTNLCISKPDPSVDTDVRATHYNGSDGVYLIFSKDNMSNNQMSNLTNQMYTWFITDDKRGTEYTNPMMGIPITCNGTACNNETDDNTYISGNTNSTNATIVSFNTQNDRFYGTTASASPYVGGIRMGSYAAGNLGTSTGRYTAYVGANVETKAYYLGSRCMYAVEY